MVCPVHVQLLINIDFRDIVYRVNLDQARCGLPASDPWIPIDQCLWDMQAWCCIHPPVLMVYVFNSCLFLPTCYFLSHMTAFSLCSWCRTHWDTASEDRGSALFCSHSRLHHHLPDDKFWNKAIFPWKRAPICMFWFSLQKERTSVFEGFCGDDFKTIQILALR